MTKTAKRSILFTAVVFLFFSRAFPVCALDGKSGEPADLLKDAKREFCLVEKGKEPAWSPSLVLKKPGVCKVNARFVFSVKEISELVSLTLVKPLDTYGWTWTLNGKEVPVPVEGMWYMAIPGIPVSLLKKGENVLLASWTFHVIEEKKKESTTEKVEPGEDEFKPKAVELEARLLGLEEQHLAFQTGPILGYAGKTFFTVTCRTTMPAAVLLETDGRTFVSEPGLLHAFRVDELKPGTSCNYWMTTSLPGLERKVKTGPFSVRTFPDGDKLTFIALGDAQVKNRGDNDWEKVATAVFKANPNFTIFTGDMTNHGKFDHLWDENFFSLAKEYFATIPFYAVLGNHECYDNGWEERDSPLFTRIICTPGNRENWSQQIGPALFIGIRYGESGTERENYWKVGGKHHRWLEAVLASSKAKFIFLISHIPPTSAYPLIKNHWPQVTRNMEEEVMPLLAKYEATAMITGHCHYYQRFERKNGVTLIITGGAGGPLTEAQVPNSEAFAKRFHFTLFAVDGDTCTMKAVAPEGEVFDTRVWTARKTRR